MIAKILEVRDRATFMPVLAVKLNPASEGERYLLGRAGYGTAPEDQAQYTMVYALELDEGHYDPNSWPNNMTRTMPIAHQYILTHFDELVSGDVVDVEYILGEREKPKVSERVSVPW